MRTIMLGLVLSLVVIALPGRVGAVGISVPAFTVSITPDPVVANSIVNLAILSQPHMQCAGSYSYSGAKPVKLARRATNASGHIAWTWRATTKASGGTASVSCSGSTTHGVMSESATLRFTIGRKLAQAIKTATKVPTRTATPVVDLPTDTEVPGTNTPVPAQASATPVIQTGGGGGVATSPDAPGITVSAANLHVDDPGSVPPPAGEEYVTTHITIINAGGPTYDYNPLDFTLQDPDTGIEYKANALDTNLLNGGLNFGSLDSGQSVAGNIAFQVPTSLTRFVLLWRPLFEAVGIQVPVDQTGGSPAQPTATQSPGSFTVQVSVSPSAIAYGDYPTLTVQTSPGASCSIAVRYDNGRPPTSLPDNTRTADNNGTITESWHMESRSTGGSIAAACTLGSQTSSGSTTFSISG